MAFGPLLANGEAHAAPASERHPDEYSLPDLPGVSFIPTPCAGLPANAASLVEAFGSDLQGLSASELQFAVLFRARQSVEKMLESNAEIRLIDTELEDDFLRETVVENEKLVALYEVGLQELQQHIEARGMPEPDRSNAARQETDHIS